MTEKIKFKAANPPKIMKYNHLAQGGMAPFPPTPNSFTWTCWLLEVFLSKDKAAIEIAKSFALNCNCLVQTRRQLV